MTTEQQARKAAEEIAHYLDSYTPLSVGEPVIKDLERIINKHVCASVTECIAAIEKLRDEWAMMSHNTSDGWERRELVGMRKAADEIITTLRSLQGKANERTKTK